MASLIDVADPTVIRLGRMVENSQNKTWNHIPNRPIKTFQNANMDSQVRWPDTNKVIFSDDPSSELHRLAK